MSQMIFALIVRLDQKQFITYFTNVLFLISFGKIFFVGRLAEDCDLLNNFFIQEKFHIWTSHKRTVPPRSIDPLGRGHTSSFPQVVTARPPR